jgi:hypothetical protein
MKSFVWTCGIVSFLTFPLRADFQAGAAVVDITPLKLPVLVNGGMLSRTIDTIHTRINARAIYATDGKTQIAIVVADSCMIGRELLDEVKAIAARETGIPTDRMLISATHAHSTPSAMGCLGTDSDPNYVPYLKERLVEAIVNAKARAEPARIGFAKADAAEFTAVRQWIRRPDRIVLDPFGNMTVRANMHAGAKWDDVTGEAGPEDPDLSLVSFQTRKGKPLAVLANFSMHYFGDKSIGADYFGLFSEGLSKRIAPDGKMTSIMSHGCSGDIYRVDYKIPEKDRIKPTIDDYTQGLLDIATKAYSGISYRDDVDIAMAEQRMTLAYRVPDLQRLEWAQRVVDAMGGRLAKTPTEVYAREQIILHERQKTEVVVQALRIGDIGIATTPNETYAITGLKIKAASPLQHNIVIELANGGDGYIPPPEQHAFGGYNTWAARSAGLEVMAEPKIAQSAISLLEQVSGKPRKPYRFTFGTAAQTLAGLKPQVWWRLNEFTGPHAIDETASQHLAHYEAGITYYLEGPHSDWFCQQGQKNRAPHFVGGRLRSQLEELGEHSTISLWLWNGMPNEGRDVAGWFFSRDHDHGLSEYGYHVGIGGKSGHTGRLILQTGNLDSKIFSGTTEIPRWSWQHVAIARDGSKLRVYLNGTLETEGDVPSEDISLYFFGGRSDNDSNWEGRLDEIAIFDRTLSLDEISKLSLKPSSP